jgi:hypothetical protein
MKRTQIQLTDRQYSYLKEISSQKNISLAETVREAVSFYAASTVNIDQNLRIRDALSLIGKYSSGKKDISINHDQYLENEFKEEQELKK